MAGRWSRLVQFGEEGAKGTAVAATLMWAGGGLATEERTVTTLEYADGSIVGNDDSYTAHVGATIALDPTPATYGHLPLLFEMGVETCVGAADGGGSDFVYTYNFPELVAGTTLTATVEAGDSQQMKEMDYVFAETISLTGAPGEALMMSSLLRGRAWTTTTVTTLTPDAVEAILFQKGALYVDTTFATWGNTVKASTLLGMALNITTGLKAKYTATGAVEFDFTFQDKAEYLLDITFEYNATAVANEASWRAETPLYLRLKWEGSDFGTGGTTYSKHTMILDLYGKWISFEPMSDLDGNNIMTGTFKGLYDSANTVTGSLIIVNEIADVWA